MNFYIHMVILIDECFNSVTFVRHDFHLRFQLNLIVIFYVNKLVKQIS